MPEKKKEVKRDQISWKLKFLAYVCGTLHDAPNSIQADETCGLMLILEELANEVYPEGVE